MQYNQPYGITDPNAPYINGNPSTGTMGSIPPAASIEYPQREIVNFITDASLVPDNADLHQVAKSVQSGHVIYGIDSGAVNLVSIALTPALAAYIDGMFVWVRVAITNTGPAVCSINGLGGRNIVRRGGAVLQAGDLPGGFMSLLVYNGPHGNFELYGASYAPQTGQPILGANSNLYVNGTTGDDSLYDGTAPTNATPPHGPFKTIQRAINETYKYGPSVYTMTINIAAGTYPEALHTVGVIGPTIIFNGAGITQTFVTGANNAHTFNVSTANTWMVQNLCVSTGTGTGPPCCFTSSSGASIYTNNCASGFCMYSIWEAYTGYVYPSNHTFNAGSSCTYVVAGFFNGFVGFQQDIVWTFLGTMTVNGAFAAVSSGGTMSVPVPHTPVFVNPSFVNGIRFTSVVNGVINTQGLGINFFPGTQPGGTNTGGQYV
jgi:hypothetical protein